MIGSRTCPSFCTPNSPPSRALNLRFRCSSPIWPRRFRQEPGNAEFTVYRERDNSRKFFVFEEYLDEASFDAHIHAEYGVIFNQQLSSLIEEGAPADISHQSRFSLSLSLTASKAPSGQLRSEIRKGASSCDETYVNVGF